jgi:hypothetical protein
MDLIQGLFEISTHTSTHTIDGKHSDPPRPGYDRQTNGFKTISSLSSTGPVLLLPLREESWNAGRGAAASGGCCSETQEFLRRIGAH